MNINKNIIIIPTFNESENITNIINELKIFDLDILIVDDNSPDKTSEIVKKLMIKNKKIKILERPRKLGLGSAYRDGFRYCIENDYENLIQMDADFSHRIEDLKNMSDDDLKAFYKQKLRAEQEEGSKGAGVGLIEIARKSSEFDFDFIDLNDGTSFFRLVFGV